MRQCPFSYCYGRCTTLPCRKSFVPVSVPEGTVRPANDLPTRDYATKVFGFATFGRVYGAIICISGLVNFSQYGIDALTQEVFHGNPAPINVFFAAAGFVVSSVLVLFVRTHATKAREKYLDTYHNRGEREPLIPEAIQEEEE